MLYNTCANTCISSVSECYVLKKFITEKLHLTGHNIVPTELRDISSVSKLTKYFLQKFYKYMMDKTKVLQTYCFAN